MGAKIWNLIQEKIKSKSHYRYKKLVTNSIMDNLIHVTQDKLKNLIQYLVLNYNIASFSF